MVQYAYEGWGVMTTWFHARRNALTAATAIVAMRRSTR
jgi:hypothetical protein